MTNSTVQHRRLSITMSEQMVSRLDAIALQYGIPRATLISFFVGQGVSSIEQVHESVKTGNIFAGLKLDGKDTQD